MFGGAIVLVGMVLPSKTSTREPVSTAREKSRLEKIASRKNHWQRQHIARSTSSCWIPPHQIVGSVLQNDGVRHSTAVVSLD